MLHLQNNYNFKLQQVTNHIIHCYNLPITCYAHSKRNWPIPNECTMAILLLTIMKDAFKWLLQRGLITVGATF